MKKVLLLSAISITIISFLIYFTIKSGFVDFQRKKNDTLTITASFYPLYFFTSQIVGDTATVYNLTPAGAEPHDYEPTTQDIRKLDQSDLIIINGGHMEVWADDIQKNLNDKTKIVITGEKLMDLTSTEEGEEHQDPHVWLSPAHAKSQVKSITDALIQKDPIHKELYEKNADVLIKRLTELDSDFKAGLSQCSYDTIVTSHDAYGYIARDYHLIQKSISGISPDEEPSPKQISEVAKFAKEQNVKYIFFETLLSPKYADTIAREIGVETLVFNPLEGLTEDEQKQGKDYFIVQKENLENLRKALVCK